MSSGPIKIERGRLEKLLRQTRRRISQNNTLNRKASVSVDTGYGTRPVAAPPPRVQKIALWTMRTNRLAPSSSFPATHRKWREAHG